MPTKRVDIKYVRQHADFAAVLEHYGVKLRGTGPQRTALCPFHRERKGSFSAHLDKRIFQCFGCEAKGNVIDFVMQSDEVDAREAAIIVAEISGIETAPPGASREGRARGKKSGKRSTGREKAASSDPDDAAPEVTEKEEAPNEEAAAPPDISENTPLSFSLKLDPEHPYLTARTSKAAIATFGLGFCGRGIMQKRIAIPIHNPQGELVAYAGRWASDDLPDDDDIPRYRLPKQFHKQLEVFNVHRLPNPVDAVVLVESYWSVFRLHQLGVAVVSPMGRAVSEQQRDVLLARGVTHITVLFDGDDAGRMGTEKTVALLAPHCFVRAPEVPDGFKPHSADEASIKKLVAWP